MCEVTTVVAVIGMAVGAAGAVKAGRDSMSAARANESMYQAQAKARTDKAAYDIERQENKFRRFEGTQIAHAAGSGIDLRSFYDAFADDAAESELEKSAIRWSAANDVNYLSYQGDSAMRRGRAERNAAYIKGFNAVIGSWQGGASNIRTSSGGSSAGKGGMEGVSTDGYIGGGT